MPVAQEEALADLSGLLEPFWFAVVEGISEAFDHDADRMHFLRKNTRRSINRDHIANKLREAVGDRPDVVITEENQTTYFSFCGRYKLVVKKADEDGNVELAKTQLSWDFQCQACPVLDDELFPEIVNLYLGYVDSNDPREPSVLLICPNENGHEWKYEIARPAGAATRDITPAPLPVDDSDPLVRVRPQEKADKAE